MRNACDWSASACARVPYVCPPALLALKTETLQCAPNTFIRPRSLSGGTSVWSHIVIIHVLRSANLRYPLRLCQHLKPWNSCVNTWSVIQCIFVMNEQSAKERHDIHTYSSPLAVKTSTKTKRTPLGGAFILRKLSDGTLPAFTVSVSVWKDCVTNADLSAGN